MTEDIYYYVFNPKEKDYYFAAKNAKPSFSMSNTEHLLVKGYDGFQTVDALDRELSLLSLGQIKHEEALTKLEKVVASRLEMILALAEHWSKWSNKTKLQLKAWNKQVLCFGGGVVVWTDAKRILDDDPELDFAVIETAYRGMCLYSIANEKEVNNVRHTETMAEEA